MRFYDDAGCTVQDTLIRDQIIVGTSNETVREDALKNQWNLTDLTKNGRIIESSAVAVTKIKPEPNFDINKTGKSKEKFICWKCEKQSCSGYDKCKYSKKECPTCRKYGHSPQSRLCKGGKESRDKKCFRKKSNKYTNRTEKDLSTSDESSDTDKSSDDSDYTSTDSSASEPVHTVTKARKRAPKILTLQKKTKKRGGCRRKYGNRTPRFNTFKGYGDFHTTVLINDVEVEALVDTGADVNVISRQNALSLELQWKKSKTKLKPYGSKPLRVCGKLSGTVTFADKSIRSDIFVVKENLESLLSGKTAETLGIISFNTINAVTEQQDSNNIHDTDSKIDEIVKKYPQVFEGIGKCKNRTIQLHLKDDVRPIIQPMRPIPYHLKKEV